MKGLPGEGARSGSGSHVDRGLGHGKPPPWSTLFDGDAPLTPLAYPLFSTADVAQVCAAPHRWLRERRDDSCVLTVGRGLHVARPAGAAPHWRPRIHEVGWLLAIARRGTAVPYLSGLTAAAIHGVCPPPRGRVHVTVPRQTRRRVLETLDCEVVFHHREEHCCGSPFWPEDSVHPDREAWETEWRQGELCVFRVSTAVQTALDLLHSPQRTGDPITAREVARTLVRDHPVADAVFAAGRQRRHTAVGRLLLTREWR